MCEKDTLKVVKSQASDYNEFKLRLHKEFQKISKTDDPTENWQKSQISSSQEDFQMVINSWEKKSSIELAIKELQIKNYTKTSTNPKCPLTRE